MTVTQQKLTTRARGWLRLAASLPILAVVLSGCQSLPLARMVSADDAPAKQVCVLGAPIEYSGVGRGTGVTLVEHRGTGVSPGEADRAENAIDLETALRRAGVDNPTIALAYQIVEARLAERMQARALLFPTIQGGLNYRNHRGVYQANSGQIVDVNLQSLYGGLGAGAVGSSTPAVPGIRLLAHLGDAYYAPQAADQKVTQSRFDADTTRYYTLLEVGTRYLALVEAHLRLAQYQESLKDVGEIAKITADHAKTGQGRNSDAERARSQYDLLMAAAEKTREDMGVASAELARLLAVDPATPFRPADLTPPMYEVVDPRLSLPELLDQALANHPEIVARTADVTYQEIRVRQERVRPFLPVIAVGISFGDFGGGTDTTTPRFGNFAQRTDIDLAAIWSLQNAGVGNRGLQNGARAALNQAVAAQRRVINRIGEEVSQAYSLIQARRQEIELARIRLETSQRGFKEELTRARNLQALPIEVLLTTTQLTAARQDLIRAMVGYSQAQLQLYVALGNAPTLEKR